MLQEKSQMSLAMMVHVWYVDHIMLELNVQRERN